MRIATINYDRCHPKKCNHECQYYCPVQRNGIEVVVFGKEGKPNIEENVCVGCGICANKCPFDAIKIINLPDEFTKDIIHQYGENGFRLFRIAMPSVGNIVGILGMNGIGKSTVINILAGKTIPNFGKFDEPPSWDRVIEYYRGTNIQDYFKKLSKGQIKVSYKRQYVNTLLDEFHGNVVDYLGSFSKTLNDITNIFPQLDYLLNRNMESLSGGELQLMEIAKTIADDANIYFFDEPSSYLDISQRLNMVDKIRELLKNKMVIVVEHDLAILDALADTCHIMFGVPTSYGIVSHPQGIKHAINMFLLGYLKEENVKIRNMEIRFDTTAPHSDWKGEVYFTYGNLKKNYSSFELEIKPGSVKKGEVIGIVGPNSIGKTTFVKMLANVEKPDEGKLNENFTVSYKPQYIKADIDSTVEQVISSIKMGELQKHLLESDIIPMLDMNSLYHVNIKSLSGGEMQTVAIALTLLRNADLYLLDEPSAYLDANQRMEAAKLIRKVMEKRNSSAFVVEHDVYFLDLVSDSIMVFSGIPGKKGYGEGPFSMKEGMSKFLKNIDVSFRRDDETKRPRINKKGSVLDREQKAKGELYYVQ